MPCISITAYFPTWVLPPGVVQGWLCCKCPSCCSERNQKGFPCGSMIKNPPASARDAGSIPGLGRSPGGGHVQLFETPWTVACQDPLRDLWDFSGKNTRVACHFLLQEIFLTQGLNPGLLRLLHCKQILYRWAIRKVPACKLHFTKTVFKKYHGCLNPRGYFCL